MPRLMKRKCVRKVPEHCVFVPQDSEKEYGVVMKVEEYECIRLIDYMACTQEECAAKMQVSRATVQSLYAQARRKLARFLVEGLALRIEGGNYMLAGSDPVKERSQMKIAVTYENGQIFQHFGHCPGFLICDVEDGKVVQSQMVDSSQSGCGALAGFLADLQVDVVICGGIGGGAKNHLTALGLQVLPGASGDAMAQVESYIAGTLHYDPNQECDHHDHDENHQCHGHHQCH